MEYEIYHKFLKDLGEVEYFTKLNCQLNLHNLKTIEKNCILKRKYLKRSRRRFNPFKDLNELDFRHAFRFSKENLQKIIEMIRDDLEADPLNSVRINQVPVDLQIMAAIRHWGLTEHPEVTAFIHGVTLKTLNKICKRVGSALASKASRYIRMPATLAEKERVINSFQLLADIHNVVGCLAHSSVRLKPYSGTDAVNNIDEIEPEQNHYLHIQVISDASYKIRDLDCKSRSSDSFNYNPFEMFAQTRIKERFEQNEFRGRLLLGSEKMSNTSFLLTPVRCPASTGEHDFNNAHAKTFCTVLNCLKLWQQRFGILQSEIMGTYTTGKNTIVALALLHNMAIEWNDILP